MLRGLAQALTEEYTAHGIHVANVVVDGGIDAPGIRGVYPGPVMDPARIADAYWYLYRQDPSVWTHEIQLTPAPNSPAF